MNLKDLQILDLLQHKGKISYAEIGSEVGLSVTAVKERIKKLSEEKILKSNVYLVDPPSLGLNICAFVQVLMPVPSEEANFTQQMQLIEEVQECHSITGDYSYLLKIRVNNTMELEQLMSDKITCLPGVAKTNSIIALTSFKETTQLRIPENSQ